MIHGYCNRMGFGYWVGAATVDAAEETMKLHRTILIPNDPGQPGARGEAAPKTKLRLAVPSCHGRR